MADSSRLGEDSPDALRRSARYSDPYRRSLLDTRDFNLQESSNLCDSVPKKVAERTEQCFEFYAIQQHDLLRRQAELLDDKRKRRAKAYAKKWQVLDAEWTRPVVLSVPVGDQASRAVTEDVPVALLESFSRSAMNDVHQRQRACDNVEAFLEHVQKVLPVQEQ